MLVRSRAVAPTLLLAGLSVTGCSGPVAIYERLPLPGGNALVTSAEVRTVIHSTPGSGSTAGRVTPTYITCAEPSPDVAKVVSSTVGAGGALSVQGAPERNLSPGGCGHQPRERSGHGPAHGAPRDHPASAGGAG